MALEQRVKQLESARYESGIPVDEEEDELADLRFNVGGMGKMGLESRIGEFGLAWLGNIVLFFGITFLVQYLQVSGYRVLSPAFGFAAVTGIFFLARYLKESNPYMARIFNLNGYLLTFYVALKLYFFNKDPLVTSKGIEIALLLLVAGVYLFFAVKRKQMILAGLSLLLIAISAVLSDQVHVMLPIAAVISVAAVALLYRFSWVRIVYLGIFLVYAINLIWLLNNPIMEHEMKFVTDHHTGYLYMFLAAAVFSLIALMPERGEQYSIYGILGTLIFNGLGFTFILGLFILAFFKDNYTVLTGSIALYCLVYSFILKKRSHWKITPAIYALFGFVALSVSFYGFYGFPRAYFLLAIQSLLVVSMALWFRSKFIVIMNTVLFAILLVVYLSTSPPLAGVNISFSVVAIATARILNWKKELLTIRTEFIRNFYLFFAFFMVLITLYHMMPDQYITLSWSIAAALYFVFSLILKNVKYRYLALATMIAAAFYLFIVDLARIDLVYRVIALFFLSVISIGLSLYYTKKLRKRGEGE